MRIPGVRLPQLYYAVTLLDEGGFTWFRRDPRPEPVAPPEWAIYHYDRLTAEVQCLMEELVDEHLTTEEAEALRRYLQRARGWGIRLQKEPLPVRYFMDREIGRGTITYRGYIRHGPGEYIAFLKLAEESGYDLPFQVWGYHNPMERGRRAPANLPESPLIVELTELRDLY